MEILASAADSPIAGFSELFGSVEGLNSMMVLTSETGSKDMIGAMEAMQNSAGATETAYNKMMDTKGNELEISLNKLKIAGIDAGNALAPAIVEIADSVAGLTQQFTALDPKVQRNIIKFLAISAAAGPVLKIFGGLTSGIGKTVSLFGKLAGSSAKAAGGAAGLTKGLGSAASGVAKLGGLAGKLPGIL